MQTIELKNFKEDILNKRLAHLTKEDNHHNMILSLYQNPMSTYKVYSDPTIALRKKTYELVEKLDLPNCLLPNFLISENGVLVGENNKTLIGYQSLLENNFFTIEDKIIIAQKLVSIIEDFYTKDIIHTDLIAENVLSNGKDIIINSMEDVIDISNRTDSEKQKLIDNNRFNLILTILSFLYETDIYSVIDEDFKNLYSSLSIPKKLNPKALYHSLEAIDGSDLVSDYKIIKGKEKKKQM